MGLKELLFLVPQLLVYLLFQVVGLVEIGLGFRAIPRQLSDMSDRHRIAIHIGIDRRA